MKLSKRWIPSFVVPAVVAAGVIAAPLQANAVDLPDLSPLEVMSLMDGSVAGFQGTVVKSSNLGLPALELSSMMTPDMAAEMEDKIPEGFEDFVPAILESNLFTQAIELIAGTHKMRVYASDQGMRVQILDTMSQRDLILNASEIWAYDARSATAYTAKIDSSQLEVSDADIADATERAEAKLNEYAASVQLDLSNPDAVAQYLMDMVGTNTSLSVGKDHMVAGRGAYQLIAEPKSSNSLIDSIVLSVDAGTGMTLDVKLYSTQQEEPAFSMGFESISFGAPDASLFSFTPPPGTAIEQIEAPAELEALVPEDFKDQLETGLEGLEGLDKEALKARLEAQLDTQLEGQVLPEMIGEGWDSVIYLSALPEGVSLEMLENQLLADMFVSVSGGRAFTTPVANVLILDTGEIYAGAVTLEFLQSVAAR